jgi:hypothetical protein
LALAQSENVTRNRVKSLAAKPPFWPVGTRRKRHLAVFAAKQQPAASSLLALRRTHMPQSAEFVNKNGANSAI